MIKAFKPYWRLAAIVFVICVLLLGFHYITGTPQGASFHYNLSWFEGFRNAFWQGDLYPRFVPDLWYGMGGTDFYFYGPLPFWFASIFGEATCPGCSTSQVFSISAAWMLIFAGVSFFIFARRYFSPAWAGFGAILYVLLPVHYLVTWFVAQTIGTILAVAILPLFALATTRLIEENRGGWLFAACLTALALSHLPTTLIILHLLGLFVVCAAGLRAETWRGAITLMMRFVPWGLLGIALSAFYWLPALALLDTVSSDMLYSDYYDATKWLLLDGLPENNPIETLWFKWALILAVTTAIGAGSILYRRGQISSLLLWIIVPTLFTAFLMTIFSYPIWKYWIINKVQFPYRTLVVADFSIALAAIVIVRNLLANRLGAHAMRARMIAGFSALTLAFAYINPVSQSADVTVRGWGQTDEFLPVAPPEYIPREMMQLTLMAFRARVTDDDNNADRYLIFFEEMQLAYDAAQTAFAQDAPGATLTPQINDRMRLNVDLPGAASVRLPVASWQFWRAERADGTPVPLMTNAELGVLEIALPAGPSSVQLYLVETMPQKIGSWISLITLLGLLIGVAGLLFRAKVSVDKPLATSIR